MEAPLPQQNLATASPDARCAIFSKLTDLQSIKNAIRAYPQYSRSIYSCIREIRQGGNQIIPVSAVLKMTNLESIELPILVENEDDLVKLAKSGLSFLHLILSRKISHGIKTVSYSKFMALVEKFVVPWSQNKSHFKRVKPDFELEASEDEDFGKDEEFFEVPTSPLLKRSLTIEREDEYQNDINYDNDSGIRFIYDYGVVQLYKNNVESFKVNKITFNLLELFDRSNSLTGLEIFTQFIFLESPAEIIEKLANFFFHDLDGLKTIGLSSQVSSDVGFWIAGSEISKQISKIYFLQTNLNIFTELKFNGSAVTNLESAGVNDKMINFELPLPAKNVPLIIQKFPNVQVIGIQPVGMFRRSRISQIVEASRNYPDRHFVVFTVEDLTELKLANVEYEAMGPNKEN